MALSHVAYGFSNPTAGKILKGRDFMVQDAQTYARWDRGLGNSCPFCGTGMNEGDNGLEVRSCPKCRPIYKQDLFSKGMPSRLREAGESFSFLRWAIIRRAEADSAEAGWPFERRKQLVDDIISIWIYGYVPAPGHIPTQGHAAAQRAAAQARQTAGDARRAAIASRSTY